MRNGGNDAEIQQAFTEALSYKAKDGFEAEKNRQFGAPVNESMSTIGG